MASVRSQPTLREGGCTRCSNTWCGLLVQRGLAAVERDLAFGEPWFECLLSFFYVEKAAA